MNLMYQLKEVGNVVVLTVENERVDHHLAGELKELIYLTVHEKQPRIILDLHAVKEMDSSGIGALLFGKRQANAQEGDLLLVGVAPAIQGMLRIAQLDRIFSQYASVEEALAEDDFS